MVENDNTVKVEVDMEPLKLAFENVALGFTEQGTAIRRLKLSNIVLAALLVGNFVMDIFL